MFPRYSPYYAYLARMHIASLTDYSASKVAKVVVHVRHKIVSVRAKV